MTDAALLELRALRAEIAALRESHDEMARRLLSQSDRRLGAVLVPLLGGLLEGHGFTAADLAGVRSGVDASTSAYLFTHPDVNAFFTGLQGQSKSVVAKQTKEYLDSNPQVRAEVTAIRQPAIDLRNRCGIPLAADISGVL